MLIGIRNNPPGTSFYIELEDDYIKWSDVIAITYINDNKIRLNDEGFAFSTLDNKQFLRLKWANDVIKMLMRNAHFDVKLKYNCLYQTCTDVIQASKCFLDICDAIRLIGAYFYELDNIKVVAELIHEDIQKAAEEIFLANDTANAKEIVDIVGKKTLESYMHNDRMDFYIYFNLFEQISAMSEQEMLKFKNEILNR